MKVPIITENQVKRLVREEVEKKEFRIRTEQRIRKLVKEEVEKREFKTLRLIENLNKRIRKLQEELKKR